MMFINSKTIIFLIVIAGFAGCAGNRKSEDEKIKKVLESSASYYVQKGTAASDSGRYREAIDNFRKAMELTPYDPVLYNNLGVTFFRMAEMDSAIKAYQTSIRLRPGYARAYTNLANVYLDLQNYNLALQAANAAIKKDPKYVDAYVMQAEIYSQMDKLEDAIDSYITAIQIMPDVASFYVNLGSLYLQKDMIAEAIENYEKGIELDSTRSEFYFNLGNAYARFCKAEEAKKYYNIALELNPELISARNNKGLILMGQGEAEMATREFRRAKQGNERAVLLFNISLALQLQDSLQSALDNVNQAIQLDSTIARFYVHKANILSHFDLQEEAVKEYKKAIMLDPNLATSYNNLGNALVKLNRIDEAQAAYEKAVALFPENIENRYYAYGKNVSSGINDFLGPCIDIRKLKSEYALIYTNLGNVYLEQNKPDEAQSAFHKAIEIQPYLIEPHERLARIAIEAGRKKDAEKFLAESRFYQAIGFMERDSLELAVEYMKQSLMLRPDFSPAFAYLGRLYERLGQEDVAVANYQKALKIANDPVSDLLYGQYLNRQKKWSQAVEYLLNVTDKNPDNLEAHQGLALAFDNLGIVEKADMHRAVIHYLSGRNFEYTGSWDRAVEEYKRAFDLDSSKANYLAAQGLILAKKHKFQPADSLFSAALRMDASNVYAFYGLGLIYGDQQLYEKAIDFLNKAIAVDFSFGRAHYALAVNYYFNKEIHKARFHLERARDLGVAVKEEFVQELQSAQVDF